MRPRTVGFEPSKAQQRAGGPVAKMLPPDAVLMLTEAARSDPVFRIRTIARATMRIKNKYPDFFR